VSNVSKEAARAARYPSLVVRVYCAVYQRKPIEARVGPINVEIANRRCVVQHPKPLDADGQLSVACRKLLIEAVQAAVRRTGLRMCVVWAPFSSTYVEAHSTVDSTDPPSGGLELPPEIAFRRVRTTEEPIRKTPAKSDCA